MQNRKTKKTYLSTERRNAQMLENVVERSEPVALDEILGLDKVKAKELEYESR